MIKILNSNACSKFHKEVQCLDGCIGRILLVILLMRWKLWENSRSQTDMYSLICLPPQKGQMFHKVPR